MSSPKIDLRRVRRTSWREYAVRFVFGGAITAAAGYISHRFGPSVGGLFLAFPAILPATLTLIGSHEGSSGAARNAFGAIAGSIGLFAFAAAAGSLTIHLPPWQVLALATVAWLAVSILALRVLRRFS